MPTTESSPFVLDTAPRERRSVFGNYGRTPDDGAADLSDAATGDTPPAATAQGRGEFALTRSFVHQFLARAFDYPAEETWTWLTAPDIQDTLALAVAALEPDRSAPLRTAQEALARAFVPGGFAAFHDGYIAAIGHAARGSCPVNEIEYGDLKADPLFQPHRLADLAAFYRAFGLEVGPGSDERLDHLSVELEFMGVLAAQEATLLNSDADAEALAVCREGQRKFLREHVGRWTPAFARRLQRAVGETPLGALAGFVLGFIESECGRAGVTPGSEDLLLRPADEAASLCDGCGIQSLPPGATTAA